MEADQVEMNFELLFLFCHDQSQLNLQELQKNSINIIIILISSHNNNNNNYILYTIVSDLHVCVSSCVCFCVCMSISTYILYYNKRPH